ncbi:MAG: lytic transglycosylase domain-containing protein [Burkholderiales bacterium]
MYFLALVRALIVVSLLLAAPFAGAESPDDTLLAAHEAWQMRNVAALEKYNKQLTNDPLADYALYWLLDARLSQPTPVAASDVLAFFSHYPASPLGDPLRISWLKALGRAQDWDNFAAQVTPGALEDPEVACDQLQLRLRKQDPAAIREARTLWFGRKTLPNSCDPVFRQLATQNAISRDDIWSALRQSLSSSNLTLARYINSFLPPFQGLSEDALTLAYTRPAQVLESWDPHDDSPPKRELILFALSQLAARHPQQAADTWTNLSHTFPVRDQFYGWLQIAWQSTMLHHPNALLWFHNAPESLMDDSLRAARARAALLEENWGELLNAINSMSATESAKAVWRYWKARALNALARPAEAQALLAPLSQESHYYGLMALEETGGHFALPTPPAPLAPDEITSLQARFERALRLHRLALAPESQYEWTVANRPLTPRQRFAAAALAEREQWLDRAIYSIERAGDQQDYGLRYPLPFEFQLRQQAQRNQLDAAWVYGLVRQESHFFPEARSRTGAMGLMQLMPATARWVAQRIPLKKFHASMTTQVDINLQLGTHYLHHLLNQLGDPILATAAYNAGPNRVLRWVSSKPQDAAIFIETIPLNETRGYVQHVMFNTTIYAYRLGLTPLSLHQRIGVIQGMTPSRNSEPDPASQP